MNKRKLKLIVAIWFLLLISSCGKKDIKEDEINKDNITSIDDSTNWINIFNQWKYLESANFFEKIENRNKEENIYLIQSYLNYWNYYYKENEYAKKARDVLEKLEDTFDKFYYIWYSYEISSEFDKALDQYNKAKNIENITNLQKAIIENQIWHIYDLRWEIEEANKYYVESEKKWLWLVWNLLNRWRYEYRVNNIIEAEKYFLEVLEKSNDSFTKSEIYFNLSSIYLKNKDTYNKAIEYSEKWINENKDYPLNYLNKWIWYLSLWWNENINKSIEQFNKTLELYPNSALANKYLWISYYILDDFDNSIIYFKKQLENSKKDILLMQNEKNNNYNSALYDLSRTYSMINNIDESLNYLEQLLWNWNNITYYTMLLRDFSKNNWPFTNIYKDIKFKVFLEKIINIYK